MFCSILGLWGILPLGLGPQGWAPSQGMGLQLGLSSVGHFHNFCSIFTPGNLVGRTSKHEIVLREFCWRGGGSISVVSGVKGTTRKSTGAQRLNQQLGSLHGTNLGSLHKCYSWITWYSCEIPNSESRSYLSLCCLFLGPILLTRFSHPALIEEELPSLPATWYTMDGWYPWEALP